MLIPLRHGQMSARRWPVVTFALIAINVLVFLFTTGTFDQESERLGKLQLRIFVLAASHPELKTPPEAEKLISEFKNDNPEIWQELKTKVTPELVFREEGDSLVNSSDPASLQAQMDVLGQKLHEFLEGSTLWRYSFVPGRRHVWSYLTANFLHGGWIHLIGNMWFLWLAGFILEDLWGRPLYAGFYLLAGAAAMQFHAWTNPGSLTPALGASGAVAGLMGAFLVRFPRMKIRMGWLLFWRLIKFDAAAYWLLPAWLLVEVLDGSFASGTGVAHWAHVGGFVFGAGAALAIRHSGWEQKANAAIEKRVNLLNDPEIRQAIGMLDREELAGAAGLLESYLETHPESLDGWSLLAQTYHRKGDLPAYYGAITRVCELHLQAREKEAAWDAFMEFRSRGGISMPVKTWLSVCHVADDLKEFDRSLQEYRKLIAAFPDTREALQANLNAGRISLNNLGRPQEALSFYEAAAASPVPHLDCEQQIQRGITESRSAMSKTAVSGA